MKVVTDIIGNAHNPEWAKRLKGFMVEHVDLDQWTAQKSRFLAKNAEYAIALKRHAQVADGDIIIYEPQDRRAVILRLNLSPVLVIDLSALLKKDAKELLRLSVELGHAIGNQHWPAVVKGTKVYVPLTVDKKVMLSVMDTHHLEGITYDFQPGQEVIPYLAPHEIRRLFGGASQENHLH